MDKSNSIQIGELVYGRLVVPIRQLTDPGQYPGKVVQDSDLPPALALAFNVWRTCSAVPAQDCAYLHDFQRFMSCKGL